MEWDPERALEAVELERRLHPEETFEELSERIEAEWLLDAVREMATLAHFGKDPLYRKLAREAMRGNGFNWSAWFMGREFQRQQDNERDGNPPIF